MCELWALLKSRHQVHDKEKEEAGYHAVFLSSSHLIGVNVGEGGAVLPFNQWLLYPNTRKYHPALRQVHFNRMRTQGPLRGSITSTTLRATHLVRNKWWRRVHKWFDNSHLSSKPPCRSNVAQRHLQRVRKTLPEKKARWKEEYYGMCTWIALPWYIACTHIHTRSSLRWRVLMDSQ